MSYLLKSFPLTYFSEPHEPRRYCAFRALEIFAKLPPRRAGIEHFAKLVIVLLGPRLPGVFMALLRRFLYRLVQLIQHRVQRPYYLRPVADVVSVQHLTGKRMLMLIGRGGEGKSRIGVVLRSLLGSNMATGSIAKIEASRFARADLEHELVMLDDDMKLEALPQTNHIKAIVTAELPMDLERKGQQSYQGDLYVRFLGFGNGSLKALYDRSEGFFRRQIILTTKPKDSNREDDPFIAEKMCAEAEGIFLWCLEGLQRLIANNYHFTVSERARENMAEAVSDGNNAVDFMRSEGYIRLKADAEASSREIYAVYKLWCDDNALHALSARSLAAFLNENRREYNLEPTNNLYLPGGRRVRGYFGIEVLQRVS